MEIGLSCAEQKIDGSFAYLIPAFQRKLKNKNALKCQILTQMFSPTECAERLMISVILIDFCFSRQAAIIVVDLI